MLEATKVTTDRPTKHKCGVIVPLLDRQEGARVHHCHSLHLLENTKTSHNMIPHISRIIIGADLDMVSQSAFHMANHNPPFNPGDICTYEPQIRDGSSWITPAYVCLYIYIYMYIYI